MQTQSNFYQQVAKLLESGQNALPGRHIQRRFATTKLFNIQTWFCIQADPKCLWSINAHFWIKLYIIMSQASNVPNVSPNIQNESCLLLVMFKSQLLTNYRQQLFALECATTHTNQNFTLDVLCFFLRSGCTNPLLKQEMWEVVLKLHCLFW